MQKLWVYHGLKENVFEVAETKEEIYEKTGLNMEEATSSDILNELGIIHPEKIIFDYIVVEKKV